MSGSISSKLISRRYAKALFSLCEQKSNSAYVQADLQKLVEVFKDSKELQKYISNPTISLADIEKIIGDISTKLNIDSPSKSFLKVLIQNRRLNLIEEINDFFNNFVMKSNGEIAATLITVKPVAKEKIEEFEKRLSSSVGKKVKLKTQCDKSILGGAIIKIGSKMLDSSLNEKINQIELISKKAISNI